MRPLISNQYPATALAKPHAAKAARAERVPRSDARDFMLLLLFVSAFMTGGYLALWKPLLASLLP